MKVRTVSNTDLPGAFVIEAETPEDVLILRMFCNEKRDIRIANYGGNITEGRYGMLIKHKPEEKNDEPS